MATTVCSIGDAYLPASFNGVPFTAIEVTSEHGRRGAEGEFPFGENTAYADLGRRIRTYSLTGRLENDNHVAQAAALIVACELPGPGVLVHPTRGIVSAACKSLKVRDDLDEEQGVTYVDMEFVEGNLFPNGLQFLGSLFGFAIGTIITAARTSFRARYRPAAVSSLRRPQVRATAQTAVSQIRVEYERAIAGTTDIRKYRALADLRDVENDPFQLDDVDIADRAIALGLTAVAQETSGQAKFEAMRRLANLNAKVSTLTNEAGRDSEDAVFSTVRTIAAVYMAQGVTETTYARTGDVFAAIDAISAVLSDEAEAARVRCDNALFDEIAKFKVDVEKQLYDQAYKLPALVSYKFSGAQHPLVAAYSIFGDAKRHREIEAGNIIDFTGRVGPAVVASSA